MARKDAKAQKNLAALRLSGLARKKNTNHQIIINHGTQRREGAKKNLATLRLSEKNTRRKISNTPTSSQPSH